MQKKIMDFEHPTCKGRSSNILSTSNTFALTGRQCYGNPLPKALPWASYGIYWAFSPLKLKPKLE